MAKPFKRPAESASAGKPGASKKQRTTPSKADGGKKSGKKGKQAPKEEVERKTGKELKQTRKLHKPHGDIVEHAKKLWEQIRQHNIEPAKRAQLVNELCELISGHMYDVIFRHDAARVVQCCIQFGTPEQRQAVFDELKEHFVDLMKSIYGKFVVSKMLDYGTKDHKAQIITAMYGQVRKLIKHAEAANIVDAVFTDHANSAQRTALVQEFYSPEYSIFKAANIKTLAELIAEKPDKRDTVTKFVQETLMATIAKGTVSYSIVHRVLREFFECADDPMKQEMAAAVAEHIVSILHTRDGSLAAMHVLWNLPAKDRKAVVKTFKGHVIKIAREEYGHHVLLALMDQMDDTVLVKKSIVAELLPELESLCHDKFARLVLLYMLTPRNGRYLHPAHIQTLSLGDTNPFSKKDKAVRQREVREAIAAPLLKTVAEHAGEWLQEGKAAQIVEEAILHADGAEAERDAAVRAVVSLVDGDDGEGALEHPVAGLVLKRLILSPITLDNERLGAVVWERAKAHVARIAESRQGCYTLAALLHEDQPADLRAAVARDLSKAALPAPDTTADNGKPLPGAVLAKAVHTALEATGTKAAAKATPGKQRRKAK